jgi:hypothetical protein
MFQSVTQRLIAVSGGIIASLMLCVVLFGLLRGYSYDSDRGLLTIPYADGSRIGVGVCYQNGLPTVCFTNWHANGSIRSSGFARFKSWQSLWKDNNPYAADYIEETEFHDNGTRKGFVILQNNNTGAGGRTLGLAPEWNEISPFQEPRSQSPRRTPSVVPVRTNQNRNADERRQSRGACPMVLSIW